MAAVTSSNAAHPPHAQPRRANGPADGNPTLGPDPQLVAEMKHEINALVQEITKLSAQDISPDEFYSGLLARIVSAMAATGGAVWLKTENGQLKLQFQINLANSGIDSSARSRSQHSLLLKNVVDSGQALLAPPSSGKNTDSSPGNPTESLIVLAPFVVEDESQGLIEIFQRPGGAPSAQRGYLRFLVQMCDLACGYIKGRRLRQLEETHSLWRQLEGFLATIHESLDRREAAYAIVNEGRRVIGCDRLTLAICCGSKCQVEAVSGLDTLDRRASEVRALSQLAMAVVKTGESIWSDGSDDLPPQIQAPLHTYIDRSHARLIGVLPLTTKAEFNDASPSTSEAEKTASHPIGALIIEQFRDSAATETLRSRATAVAHHSGQALVNALNHSGIFLLPLWQALGQVTWLFHGSGLAKSKIALAAAASLIAALVLIPTSFEIQARGKLQPSERSEIFAPLDGLVSSVPVEHGQIVESGAVLAQMTNTDLDLQLAAALGRQTTNHERLTAVERILLDNKGGTARLSPVEENRLFGERLQLVQEAESIDRELTLLREKQGQLSVVAPERGQVVTWKVRDLLIKRPVARGQGLMTLANPDGPWELELYLPERRLYHVQRAQTNAHSLDVTFVLSSHPGQTFHGTVAELEQTAEVRGDEGNTILVRVAMEKSQLPQLHDQTTVTAKLNCGRTSIGYAWFCDLIETVQSKILFWLPT
ncbi:MAG TPA: HlyD family efflux transporter periplasmic adaptor subunit [Pirellulaceae bacterium]|jgi:multidrug efflux pump subunit AcrA (membrane-fusion protein)